jgi:hypothetical protein
VVRKHHKIVEVPRVVISLVVCGRSAKFKVGEMPRRPVIPLVFAACFMMGMG